MKNILCLFAHPDDEVLSMGGSIAKFVEEEMTVNVAFLATGAMSREKSSEADLRSLRKDSLSALSYLGVREPYFGFFPDNQMDTLSLLEISREVSKLINRYQPDTIFTHHSKCANVDHRLTWEALMLASRDYARACTILSCETPSSTGWLPSSYIPNFYVELSRENLISKQEALKLYLTEIRSFPHQRSPEYLEALAKVRGSEVGVSYAEGFILCRLVVA